MLTTTLISSISIPTYRSSMLPSLKKMYYVKQCIAFFLTFIVLYAIGIIFFGELELQKVDDDINIMQFRKERFEVYQNQPPREGPGEGGKEYSVPPDKQAIADQLFKNASFNIYGSDRIALDRSIPDTRLPL